MSYMETGRKHFWKRKDGGIFSFTFALLSMEREIIMWKHAPRSLGRTDIIVDYRGERFVIETKIWRGNEYNSRGERQIIEYLDDYGLQTGYMLSFNFNRKKQVGIQEIKIGGKRIIEAVVSFILLMNT